MTTNDEKPFEPGESIAFCDEQFIVEANHGRSGTVRELGTNRLISNFYWRFEGEDCRRTENVAA